jgi:putative transposase
MVTVTQAYQFALDPTPRQRRALASHCGAARVAYNWGLQLVEARLQQRRAGKDVDLPWTLFQLQWEWNRAKQQVAPWWAENSKEAYKSGLDGLARALQNWTDSRAGRRKGPPGQVPAQEEEGPLSGRLPLHYRFHQGAGRPHAHPASPDRHPQDP